MTPNQYRRDSWKQEMDRLIASDAYQRASPLRRDEMTERLIEREMAQIGEHEDEPLFPRWLRIQVAVILALLAAGLVLAFW